MNRRGWLKTIATMVPTCLVAKVMGKTTPVDDGKMGYVAIGVHDEHGKYLFSPGDVRVYVNGKPWLERYKAIQRANDREGWIEYIDIGPSDRSHYWKTIHVKADVRLERIGSAP